MTNTQLYNDKVSTFQITGLNGSGGAVNIPVTAGLIATSGKPDSLAAVAAVATDGTNQWRLTVTPLVQASAGIAVTVSGSGITVGTETFDIVSDPTVLAGLSIGTSPVSATPQPVPTAPGP